MTRRLYTLLLWLLLPFMPLRLLWRARRQPGYLRHAGERFGVYLAAPARPVIWVHAVSVGETRAAASLVAALGQRYPDHALLITHTTPTGRETGEQLFGAGVLRCYLPLDIPFAVNRFLSHFRPAIGLLMETELWPNLIHACRQRGIPALLVNARLSQRSYRRYARFPMLAEAAFGGLAAVLAQTGADAGRIGKLGARQVEVTGNLKFDLDPPPAQLELGRRLRERFGGRPTLLAASTRDGEEELVLDAVARMDVPRLLTVIVPRHPQRFDAVAALLGKRGLKFERRSQERPVAADTAVVLGDSMGELFAYYAAADAAFVGGSLVPLGGQNLIEACAVGTPVLIGPHTFNFEEASRLAVEAGAAWRVSGPAELAGQASRLLNDPALRATAAAAGRAFAARHRGATQRTLAKISAALGSPPPHSPR